MRRFRIVPALLACSVSLVGCATPGYYWQAISGQLELWQRTRPIEQVAADPAVASEVKQKLAAVERIRDFASHELALPQNGSYRSYADLKRPYVVWNVFATNEFSITPKQWCFAVAGCVGYRGYFSKDAADRFAEGLRAQGYDVFVAGVPAYSTLGWFDDPVLNTFIHYPESELARLMFHELAHQAVYVKGDSEFNESFASTVELEGVKRWLGRHGSAEQQAAFEHAEQRRDGFRSLVHGYRARLAALFKSGLAASDKRREKAAILAQLKREYQTIKNGWGGYSGYDRWFAQDINNATLASVGLYTALVPAFQALLAARGHDLVRFYTAAKEVGGLVPSERKRKLAEIASSAPHVGSGL